MDNIMYSLLCQLGLEVKDGIIVEQGNQRPLIFNSKIMKLYDREHPCLLNSETEIWFDPIHNIELAEKLTQYYAIELASSENIILQKIDIVNNNNKYKLVCTRIANGEKTIIETREYHSLSLPYLEVILDFDYTQLLELDV